MLGLSTKTIYAVSALYQLGKLAQNERMTIKEIAQRADVPSNFLEQILLELKKKGLLQSIKGAYGGYRLAKPLESITLKEVVETLESGIFENIYKGEDAALRLFWNEFKKQSEKLFELPLSDLKNCEIRVTGALHYTI